MSAETHRVLTPLIAEPAATEPALSPSAPAFSTVAHKSAAGLQETVPEPAVSDGRPY